MENREAARYARWSAGIAVAICLVVVAVYLQRHMRSDAREKNVKPVPATVAQQSAEFSFSKTIGPRTLFTVRATQATQFKDQNRSLLENVTITIYGARGERDDSVRADECSYEPESGSIRCQGVVQIGLHNAKAAAGNGMQLQTSDILFERDSGKASTDKAVTLQFPGGHGEAMGVLYDPQNEDVTLEKNVQLEIAASKKTGGLPVNLAGSALEFRRNEDSLHISGPVRVSEGARALVAGMLEVQLDSAMRPAHVMAAGNPEISETSPRGKRKLSARRMEAEFTQARTLSKLIADENVRGESDRGETGNASTTTFSARHAELLMSDQGGISELLSLAAQGDAQVEMRRGDVRRIMKTQSLQMNFASEEQGRGQRIASAETLAPAEIITSDPKESARIRAGKLQADFGPRSELAGLRGSGGVEIVRTPAGKSAETSTAQNFSASFAPNGQWQTIHESGDVKFKESGRDGHADNAEIARATNDVTLSGSAFVEDATSQLQAQQIRINQTMGEAHARGGVAASYFGKPGANGNAAGRRSRAAQNAIHISADVMNGTGFAKSQTPQGHAVFWGHARMWAGSNVLQADTIEVWQGEQRVEARGNVTGEFVETAHRNASKKGEGKATPVLWKVTAPQADYWSESGKMAWSGGVRAASSEGSISAETLELLFSKQEGNREVLERANGTGGVRIEQNGRVGTAENCEYDAAEGRFRLFGGQPRLTDGSGNSSTGCELTFFLGNDAILVDSADHSQDKN